MKKIALLFALGLPVYYCQAQLSVASGATMYIGSGATVAVKDGDVILNAASTGSGTLLLNGTTAQNLDANSNMIPNLEVNNAAGVILKSNAAVSNVLTLSAGPVSLGNFNMTLGSGATTSGAGTASYLVTNGSGVVTKQALANAAAFTFPVGYTAATDYTPATVTNGAAARDISVRVQDVAGTSPSSATTAAAVNRIWQVTSPTVGSATVALTNNAANEVNSFNRAAAFVTQQIANGVWDIAATGAPTTPNYTHSRAGLTIPASGTTSYFSKSSDVNASISSNKQLDLVVGLQGVMQGNGTMTSTLQDYSGTNSDLLPTTDPYGTGTTYAAINSTAGAAGAVVDWVKVQVRDAANPGTVLQTKALLLKTDGHIVDVDGTVPVFNGSASPARVAVLHRNHLAVLSNAVSGTKFAGAGAYDFTTALSQASDDFGDLNQMVKQNNKWCLWAGDLNQDFFLDGTDVGQVTSGYFKNNDTYQLPDITMDGYVEGSDIGKMSLNYRIRPASTLYNY